jgi:hypothetical protein
LSRHSRDFCPLPCTQFGGASLAAFCAARPPSRHSFCVFAVLLWCWLSVFDLAGGNVHNELGKLIGVAGALKRFWHRSIA